MKSLNPNPLGPVYSATKAAVIALTRSWAANSEVTNAGIRLNVYCPAFADTALVSNLNKETCLDVNKAKEFVNYIGVMA
ncbi:hypothetical protein KUTeg_018852 [Tegillarca granosa]|uniref:15-hydroxyprostaglandin dehydrogenase [NAD(+)] n=1 Tax=Tegillarca granosa TaxID=220873 RepID=A0ABQ9EF30_TEGGR|nr:hypothetical protein KUTeg_018852 [Tegillarca granosa]